MSEERRIERLEFELAEAGTDILDLRKQLAERDKLVEQMREALAAAKNDGKMQSAITYQLIRAALSATERIKP